MAKLYDVTVTTGTYEVNGKKHYNSVRVGAVWEGKNGPYLRMNRTFNPAGVPVSDPSADSIICNMFEPRDGQGSYQAAAPQANAAKTPAAGVSFDDDVPF